jgi:hypothetical protein
MRPGMHKWVHTFANRHDIRPAVRILADPYLSIGNIEHHVCTAHERICKDEGDMAEDLGRRPQRESEDALPVIVLVQRVLERDFDRGVA